MTRLLFLAVLVGLMAAIAGCSDPYRGSSAMTVDGERRAPKVQRHDAAPDTAVTPAALVRRAVRLSGNWTSRTVVRQYAAFARLMVAPARQPAEQAAARISADPQTTAPGSTSTATLELLELRGRGRRRSAVIVTREQLRADGHTASRWRVTLATAVRVRGGWALSRWEPQP